MPAKLQGKLHSNGAAVDFVRTAPASDAVLSAHEMSVGGTESKLWGKLPAGEAGAALHVGIMLAKLRGRYCRCGHSLMEGSRGHYEAHRLKFGAESAHRAVIKVFSHWTPSSSVMCALHASEVLFLWLAGAPLHAEKSVYMPVALTTALGLSLLCAWKVPSPAPSVPLLCAWELLSQHRLHISCVLRNCCLLECRGAGARLCDAAVWDL